MSQVTNYIYEEYQYDKPWIQDPIINQQRLHGSYHNSGSCCHGSSAKIHDLFRWDLKQKAYNYTNPSWKHVKTMGS